MRRVIRSRRGGMIGLLGLALFLTAPAVRAAAPIENALPATTFGLIKIEDVGRLRNGIEASQFGRLLNDPAMKGLIDSVAEKLAETDKSLRGEVGLSLRELVALPQGQVTIAFVATPAGPHPAAVLAAVDTGAQAQRAADLLARLTAKARDGGEALVKTEEFKGATLTIIQNKADGADPKDAPPPLVWTRQDAIFHFASSPEVLKDLLAHADGRDDSLAATKGFQAAQKKVAGDGQVFWYLDIEQTLRFIVQAAAQNDGGNAAQIEAQLQLTGLNGLKAFAGRFGIGVGGYDQFTRMYLYRPGELQGLLKLFATPAADLRPQPWVPAHVASYQSLSWDLDKFYTALNEFVDLFSPGLLQNLEQQLAGPGGNGLSFQKDLFGPLGNRITAISDFKKPIREDSQRLLIGVALSDAKAFQTSLNQIFKLAGATPRQREFQGVTIYDFEVPELPNAQLPKNLSMAIAKDQLFVGEQSLLEQVLRGGGPSLADSPAFQAVAQHYPPRSFSLSYQRADEAARALYDMVKGGQLKELIEQQARQAGQDLPDTDLIDPKNLPDFSVFAKYLTQAGGFGLTDEDGALFTSFSVKPTTP